MSMRNSKPALPVRQDFRDDLQRPRVRLLLILATFAVLWPLWLKTPLWVAGFSLFTLLVAATPQRNWPRTLLALLVVAATAGVVVQHRSLFSREAGLSLLALMASFKMLELRNARDAMLLIAVAFFLLFAGFLFHTDLLFSGYLLLTVPLLTLALLVLNDRDGWQGVKRLAGDSGRVLLFALPMVLLLYVFFPRLNVPLWRLPGQGATSGLSDEMTIGDVRSLSLNDEPAFRIRFDGQRPPEDKLYFRALTLNSYDGYTWRNRFLGRDLLTPRGEPLRYEMIREPRRELWLTALDMPLRWAGPNIVQDREGAPRLLIANRRREAFQFESALDYRLGDRLDARARAAYTQLPAGNERSKRWALEQRARFSSDAAFVQFLMQHINSNDYWYTLSPPEFAEDIVDDFWFNKTRGFCEHYANAVAVLLRAADVPARVVTGYQGGEWNSYGNFLTVTDANAHAWLEFWSDEQGWQRLDPTAAIAPSRVEADLRQRLRSRESLYALNDWGQLLDAPVGAFAAGWKAVNDWFEAHVVQFNAGAQRDLLGRLGMPDIDTRTLLRISVFSIIGLLAVAALWLMWSVPRRDRAGRIYAAFQRKLVRNGLPRDASEAPLHLLQRATHHFPRQRREIAALIRAYCACRYGGADDSALRAAWRALRFQRLQTL